MCFQGVTYSKEACNYPGLCPAKGHKSSLCSWTRGWNQFWSQSLGSDKTPAHYHMLTVYPAVHLSSYILSRDPPQGRFRSDKLFNSTVPCGLVGNSISSYPRISRDPKQPTLCQVEMSFNAFWYCCTNGDVILAVWRAFRATWLSIKIQTYFSDLAFIWISWAQAKIAYIYIYIYLSLENCSILY
jgi:hypothetical protein